jgi:hypothetical protein
MTTLDRTFTATLHKSPNKGGRIYVRPQISKQTGDTVTVHLDERLAFTPLRSTR